MWIEQIGQTTIKETLTKKPLSQPTKFDILISWILNNTATTNISFKIKLKRKTKKKKRHEKNNTHEWEKHRFGTKLRQLFESFKFLIEIQCWFNGQIGQKWTACARWFEYFVFLVWSFEIFKTFCNQPFRLNTLSKRCPTRSSTNKLNRKHYSIRLRQGTSKAFDGLQNKS